MRARVVFVGCVLLMALVLVGASQAANSKDLYTGGSPVASQMVYAFGGWGSGTVETGDRDSYLLIKTSGYYEGGRLDVRGVAVEDAITSAKDGYLVLKLDVGQKAGAAAGVGVGGGPGGMTGSGTGSMGGPMGGGMGPMGGGMGPMGGGMGPMGGGMGPMGGGMGPMGGGMGPMGGGMGSAGGMGPGGKAGGAMGGPMGGPMGGSMGGPMGGSMGGPMGGPMGGMMGGPMGGASMYGASYEEPQIMRRLRVVLVTDSGEYGLEGIPATGVPTLDEQWTMIEVPFTKLGTPGKLPSGAIKQIRIFGDAKGEIKLGGVTLFQEDPDDVVIPKAPEDAVYEYGEPFNLSATVNDPTKQYRLHWDFDDSDGVSYSKGETGDKIEDAQYYFPGPGTYIVTVIAEPVGGRALPRLDTCTITIHAPQGTQGGGMMPGGMRGGYMGGGGGGATGVMGG